MKERLFEVIEIADNNDKVSSIYDGMMLITIICSMTPLCFKIQTELLIKLDRVTVILFIIDYSLRWFTADQKLNQKYRSYLIYPFTPLAIIDLLSILPSISLLNSSFRLLKKYSGNR